jgi:hypothetical protein
MLVIIFIIIVFLAGIYFCMKYSPDRIFQEGFESNAIKNPRCPNILIQNGSKIYLYNSKLAKIPGVNPLQFDNLEDYTEFMEWQRSQGIRCPILFLQKTYDTQGQSVYKVRPGVTEPQGGLPPAIVNNQSARRDPNPTKLIDAGRNDPPYNTNSMPSYDQSSFYVGATTPLDKMDETQDGLLYSPNAMDPNWGGAKFTQALVDRGYYADNEVAIRV